MDRLSPGGAPGAEARALLRLTLSKGWGPVRIARARAVHGSARSAVAAADPGTLAGVDEVDRVERACQGSGVRIVAQGHPEYPPRLLHLPDPPAVLFVRGDTSCLARPVVAIVGSRRATRYGRQTASLLASSSAERGWTVLSGLALGVDGAAHRGALEGEGPTAAALGHGPERAHPRAHAPLLEALLAQGCALSEYPPGIRPAAHHFPRRNRILAALAHRVVVVEAAVRSGALITAGVAADLGRDVWAVPGSILSPVSEGCHRLLADGATPVVSLDAWRASLELPAAGGGLGRPTAPGEASGSGLTPPARPGGTDLERHLWDVLDEEGRTLDSLASSLEAPWSSVLSALTSLELAGWIHRLPGPAFARRGP